MSMSLIGAKSGDADAQEIVEMHDADRPVAFHHDQRRDLQRIDKFQSFAGELPGPNRFRRCRHHLADRRPQQIVAHVAAQVAVGDDRPELAVARR